MIPDYRVFHRSPRGQSAASGSTAAKCGTAARVRISARATGGRCEAIESQRGRPVKDAVNVRPRRPLAVSLAEDIAEARGGLLGAGARGGEAVLQVGKGAEGRVRDTVGVGGGAAADEPGQQLLDGAVLPEGLVEVVVHYARADRVVLAREHLWQSGNRAIKPSRHSRHSRQSSHPCARAPGAWNGRDGGVGEGWGWEGWEVMARAGARARGRGLGWVFE
eukprot:3509993-Prymnesium_polylepis.3